MIFLVALHIFIFISLCLHFVSIFEWLTSTGDGCVCVCVCRSERLVRCQLMVQMVADDANCGQAYVHSTRATHSI